MGSGSSVSCPDGRGSDAAFETHSYAAYEGHLVRVEAEIEGRCRSGSVPERRSGSAPAIVSGIPETASEVGDRLAALTARLYEDEPVREFGSGP